MQFLALEDCSDLKSCNQIENYKSTLRKYNKYNLNFYIINKAIFFTYLAKFQICTSNLFPS